ncbi:MAG: hypothetical protein IAE80_02135, partial [Anaerolinea sp.]|nr:hypothetical protein [Anaerolinea sp.]
MPSISSPRLNEENDDLCRFLKRRLKVHPYRLQTVILSLLASTVFIIFMTVSVESRGDSVNISATYQTPENIDVLLTATYLNVQSNQTFTAVHAPFQSTLPPLLMSATEHIMRATQSAIVTPNGTLTDTLQVCELGIATRYRRDLSQEAIADLEQSGQVYSNVNIY